MPARPSCALVCVCVCMCVGLGGWGGGRGEPRDQPLSPGGGGCPVHLPFQLNFFFWRSVIPSGREASCTDPSPTWQSALPEMGSRNFARFLIQPHCLAAISKQAGGLGGLLFIPTIFCAVRKKNNKNPEAQGLEASCLQCPSGVADPPPRC